MKNLHKLFVSYDTALILKEKGFNEPCIAYYPNKVDELSFCENRNIFEHYVLIRTLPQRGISVPLFQQVSDWFRIEHNLVLDVFQEFNGVDAYTGFWEVDVSELKNYKQPHKLVIEEVFEDYYEALNKAIEEALKII